MALGASIVWETRSATGNDSWGGGFKAGATGTDRSQQNAAQVAIDNSTITTSITANVITFTGYTPTSADVGNVVQMLTGTSVTAGFYEITAQTATTWTVAGAVSLPTAGTTTNATGNMGGALATLTQLAAAMVANNKGYCTGAFTSAATITFAQSVPNDSSPTRLIGYGSVRGDAGHATLTLTTNTGLTGLFASGQAFFIEQIDVDCASLGTSTGIVVSQFCQVKRCKVSNFTFRGIRGSSSETLISECELTGGTSAASHAIVFDSNPAAGCVIERCFIHDNACTAVKVSRACIVCWNLIVNNSGAASDGVQITIDSVVIYNNTIHNQGRHGIFLNASSAVTLNAWRNNLLTGNGGYGALASSGTALAAASEYDGNAYWNNTSGARGLMDSVTGIYSVSPYTNSHDVSLTGTPYVGPTTGTSSNFALNNTAGAGAACRAAGTPGAWPGNTGTTGYLDQGAVQHADSGTGGGGPGHTLVVRGQNLPAY